MKRLSINELKAVVHHCLREGNDQKGKMASAVLKKKVVLMKRRFARWKMRKSGFIPLCPMCKTKDKVELKWFKGVRQLFCHRCKKGGAKEVLSCAA